MVFFCALRSGVVMRVIQRYLVINFVGPFIMGSMFFIIFLLTFQLFNLVKVILNKDVPFSEVLALFGKFRGQAHDRTRPPANRHESVDPIVALIVTLLETL